MNMLYTLQEWNEMATKRANPDNTHRIETGIACPNCGEELSDSVVTTALLTYPPKKPVECKCGFQGERIL